MPFPLKGSSYNPGDIDVVILATGSQPFYPPIEGIGCPDLVNATDILSGKRPFGEKILIAGGGMVGAETADFLSTYHKKDVLIMELAAEIANDMNAVSKVALMERLEKNKVQFSVNSNCTLSAFCKFWHN